MKIKTLQYSGENNELSSNTHLAFISETEVIAFDVGQKNDSLIKYLTKNDLVLRAVFLTHGHFDHIRGLKHIDKNIPIYMFNSEIELLTNANYNGSKTYPPEFIIEREANPLNDGDIIKFHEHKLEVIHTPFHTAGSVCYLINDEHMISGDTLFRHTIGRIDLISSVPRKVSESLKKIAALYDGTREIIVYPGHSENTTLSHELEHNRYFRNK